MKTDCFKRKLEENGFSVILVNDNPEEFEIYHGGICVGYIIKNFPYHMSITNYFAEMGEERRALLLDTLYEYARTPVEERENKKKYQLKHRWLDFSKKGYVLGYNSTLGEYLIVTKFFSKRFKTEFTEKEIDEIKKRFNTTLDGFEMVEVRNED